MGIKSTCQFCVMLCNLDVHGQLHNVLFLLRRVFLVKIGSVFNGGLCGRIGLGFGDFLALVGLEVEL